MSHGSCSCFGRLQCSSRSTRGGITESAAGSLQKLLERCEVSAVSLGSLASVPTYTYCSNVQTTVDYNLIGVESASMTTLCITYAQEVISRYMKGGSKVYVPIRSAEGF